VELNSNLIRKTPLISSGTVYKSLMEICKIGNRWPGTVGEKSMIDYVHNEMKSVLDKVELEEYLYPNYTPLSSSLIIKHPINRSIPCISIEYSQNSLVEGELIHIGEGWRKDFKTLLNLGNTIKDKIVIARTDRSDIVCREAEKFEAAGVIIISDSPFNTIRQLSSQLGFEKDVDLKEFGVSIPGVIVNKESGEYILSILSSNTVEVEIEHKSIVEIKKSYNVVGYLYGSKEPDEQVIIGAHYDTQLGIEGAWDNGSGCAALLEICKVCAGMKHIRTMVFCAFGCEEVGLFGSTSFVHKRENHLKNIISYINLDSTCADICFIHEVLVTRDTMEFALKIIKENTNWNINLFRQFTKLDHAQDSAEFVKYGVNAIWASEEGNPYFHTKYDTIDTISPTNLAIALRVSLLPFFYLSNIEEIPFA
jgi:hypothetical protein